MKQSTRAIAKKEGASLTDFVDAADWNTAAPLLCVTCGALVHWNYLGTHDEWHEKETA